MSSDQASTSSGAGRRGRSAPAGGPAALLPLADEVGLLWARPVPERRPR